MAVVLIAAYLGSLLLRIWAIDSVSYLGLKGQDVWQGRVWELVTYILLPMNLVSFLFNILGFVMFAPRLEQCWSRWELWSFCLISALAAGVAQCLLIPRSPVPLQGMSPVLFGLLAAWVKLFGSEDMTFMGLGTTTVRRMVLAMTIVSVVVSLASGARFLDLFIPICGGLGAWIYLALRWRKNLEIEGRQAVSSRINRLEL